MGSCSLTRARAATQDGQGPERGRILRGAAPDVQGLLQADGHQQGWPAGQERPAWRLRQRRCPHERVRARWPKVEEPAPVEEAPEAEPEEDADAKKKKKKKKKAAK